METSNGWLLGCTDCSSTVHICGTPSHLWMQSIPDHGKAFSSNLQHRPGHCIGSCSHHGSKIILAAGLWVTCLCVLVAVSLRNHTFCFKLKENVKRSDHYSVTRIEPHIGGFLEDCLQKSFIWLAVYLCKLMQMQYQFHLTQMFYHSDSQRLTSLILPKLCYFNTNVNEAQPEPPNCKHNRTKLE